MGDRHEPLSTLLDRIPHRPPMRLIDEVLEVGDAHIVTAATIAPSHILLRDGIVSPLLAIEIFAQSAAALVAHRSVAGGALHISGALLGTRSLDVFTDGFRVGDRLRAVAREAWGAGALAQFECDLYLDEARVAHGSINVTSEAVG